jgi:hypothetical protein
MSEQRGSELPKSWRQIGILTVGAVVLFVAGLTQNAVVPEWIPKSAQALTFLACMTYVAWPLFKSTPLYEKSPFLNRIVLASLVISGVGLLASSAVIVVRTPHVNTLVADNTLTPAWAVEEWCGIQVVNENYVEEVGGSNEFKIILGGTNFVGTDSPPADVISFRDRNFVDHVLSIERDRSGGLLIDATIRAEDRTIVALIEKNRLKMPDDWRADWSADQHSLVIVDETGDVVLDVYYLNSMTVVVNQGIFRYPGFATVAISPDNLEIGTARIKGICFRGPISITPNGLNFG